MPEVLNQASIQDYKPLDSRSIPKAFGTGMTAMLLLL